MEGCDSQAPKKDPRIVALVKCEYVEQIANGYEEEPFFRLLALPGFDQAAHPKVSPSEFFQAELFHSMLNTLFGSRELEKIDEKVVLGHDYLVLKACVAGDEVNLKPGDLIFLRDDNSVALLKGLNDAEISLNGDSGLFVMN